MVREVADRDEPGQQGPTKRDRPPLVNAPLRWVVVAAFVVVGALILANGFGPSSSGATGGTGSSGSGAPSTTPSRAPTRTPTNATTPSLTGITVAIYNSTSVTGLASNERQRLETDGWDVIKISNVGTSFTTTTIYYLSGAKSQAEYMKATYYPTAVVKAAPSAFHSAKISLILGTDFTATP
jgi:hypothetical protein